MGAMKTVGRRRLNAAMRSLKMSKLPKYLCLSSIVALIAVFVGSTGSPAATAASRPSAAARDFKHSAQGMGCPDCHGKVKKQTQVQTMKCLECHGDTKALAERTAKLKPTNPHDNRHYGTEADCRLCHREHAKSENFCLPCHDRFDFKVP
jgi:hypothetical protein